MGAPLQHTSLFSLPKGCPLSPSLVDLISTISRSAAPPSSLFRRCRALDGGALPDLPHRTCGSTVERSYVRPLFEGFHGDQICSWGVTRIRSVRGIVHLHASPTLHQVFHCERSASVERLQEGNKIDVLICIILDSFLGLIRSAEFFCFLLRIPTAVSELVLDA